MQIMKLFDGNSTLAENYIAAVKAIKDDLAQGSVIEGSRKLLALEASMQTVLAIGDGCDDAVALGEQAL